MDSWGTDKFHHMSNKWTNFKIVILPFSFFSFFFVFLFLCVCESRQSSCCICGNFNGQIQSRSSFSGFLKKISSSASLKWSISSSFERKCPVFFRVFLFTSILLIIFLCVCLSSVSSFHSHLLRKKLH